MANGPPPRSQQQQEKPQPQAGPAVNDRLQQALGFHQRGELDRAEVIYREILTRAPDHFDALHLLGIIEGQKGNAAAAVELISRAITVNPHDASAHSNLGNALLDLERHEEALASHERALVLVPGFAAAFNGRGNALLALKRPEAALASYDRAVELEPAYVEALNNRGNVLLDLARPAEALASYDFAIELRPDYVDAINGRGNALRGLKRSEEALASYERVLMLQPRSVEALNNRGNVLLELKRPEEALASYDGALALNPDYAEAHYNRGNVLLELKRPEEALASCDRALAMKPDYVDALHIRGNALWKLSRPEEALASFDRALAIEPDYANALYNRGSALWQLKRHGEGIADYRKLVAIAPSHDYAGGRLLHMQLYCCEWADYDRSAARIAEGVRAGRRADFPLSFLAISDSAADQLRCARIFAADSSPVASRPVWHGERYRHDRIRLAYLSADFREHVVAYCLAELFDTHDKTRFEVTAVSFGPDAPSEMRSRLSAAFDRFVDVGNKNDRDVAALLRELEIDIAVDLQGFTQGCRPGMYSHRGAPVQVNYLGYAGTMGADYIDYIIADRFVIPEEHHACYAEKVVYLPDSYMVNDSRRKIAERIPTRADAGVPEKGFVFCCFNNNYKITPTIFDVWMRLLRHIEGSVMWLSGTNTVAVRNLRREAAERGIQPERLVFAERVELIEDHLARHRLADLALDTLPYNGHATSGDALWAGLPVLTCLGTTFAGRVAASLLHAVGLPELITDSLEQYEALALELAARPALLAEIRAKLARNRATCPLFDTDRFRRHIESAYVTMWERAQRGEPPASFAVRP